MHASAFQDAISAIVERDPRFEPDAFLFLKEVLDYTVKKHKESEDGHTRHVSGPELLTGFRDFAQEQFGPMAHTLLREWGIRECSHVGEMVFALIEEQVFGKQDSDSIEDFSNIYEFEEAFVRPFQPENKALIPRI